MEYKFNIINGQNLNKLKSIRYINYYFIILLVFLLNPIRRSRFNTNSYKKYPINFASWVGINNELLIFILIIAVILATYLHFKSIEFKILGYFTYDGNLFLVNIGQEQVFITIKQINLVTILRGSTWHLSHHKNHYLIKTDNWIELNYNFGEILKFEFSIESMLQNDHFENMVKIIYDSKLNLDYKSI